MEVQLEAQNDLLTVRHNSFLRFKRKKAMVFMYLTQTYGLCFVNAWHHRHCKGAQNMTTYAHEMSLIEELESELITMADALAKLTLQPLSGRVAAQIIQLTARITETVARTL
jgi:hypothetical protein